MVVGDRPALFEGAIQNPSELVTWDDVQHCLNNPWWYNIEILDNNNLKVPVPTVPEQWHDKLVPEKAEIFNLVNNCLLYTSPSPRDATLSRMPSSA